MILLCFEKGTFDICYSVLKIVSDDDGDNADISWLLTASDIIIAGVGVFKSLCTPTASSHFR